jgi:hypothetical protein
MDNPNAAEISPVINNKYLLQRVSLQRPSQLIGLEDVGRFAIWTLIEKKCEVTRLKPFTLKYST